MTTKELKHLIKHSIETVINKLKQIDYDSKFVNGVVLPVIALLILLGGIYLYAEQKSTVVQVHTQESKVEQIANRTCKDLNMKLDFYSGSNNDILFIKCKK